MHAIKSFAKGEDGAVTVDWVVLTAALTGLGLAVATVVAGALQTASGRINEALTGVSITGAFGMADEVFASLAFDDGEMGGWTGGAVQDVVGFGEVLLAPNDGTPTTLEIDVGEHSHALVEFDMIFGDSWDVEEGYVSIAGERVATGVFDKQWDGVSWETEDGANVTLTRVSTGTGGHWRRHTREDYTYRVSVLTPNASDLSLDVSSSLDQRTTNEFLAIDNVVVVGTDGG